MKTWKNSRRLFVLSAAVVLAACGGGGGGGDAPANTPTSFWKMDAFQYVNGGFSAQSTSSTSGRPLTIVAVSTATLGGGDPANGDYAGSSITFALVGNGEAGTYKVVQDGQALINSQAGERLIRVQVVVGTARSTGSTQYTATSGELTVAKDTAGKYHFSTVDTVPTSKTLDVQGGVRNAPGSMTLFVRDAY